jgi:hypothetical protein
MYGRLGARLITPGRIANATEIAEETMTPLRGWRSDHCAHQFGIAFHEFTVKVCIHDPVAVNVIDKVKVFGAPVCGDLGVQLSPHPSSHHEVLRLRMVYHNRRCGLLGIQQEACRELHSDIFFGMQELK